MFIMTSFSNVRRWNNYFNYIIRNYFTLSISDSETDDPHGMKTPTLLRQLKVILDEYPDDAQIIRVIYHVPLLTIM